MVYDSVLFEETKIKLLSKWHVVENKTQMQHVLKCSKFPGCLNIQNEFPRVFKF
jgi:hypothetical protein